MASPSLLVDAFLRLRIPFSLSLVALWAGLVAVRSPEELERHRPFITRAGAPGMASRSSMPGLRPFPSEGNFILIDVSGTGRTSEEIVEFAHREHPHPGDERPPAPGSHVRVTIGTREQNDRFLDVFGRAIGAAPVGEATRA